jgi:CheY-like chemotaxis protein
LGLGLAISKGLVELHGGTIGAYSEGAGRGATFVVNLPAPVAGDAAAQGVGDRMPPAQAAGVRHKAATFRVLLVEDHPATAQVTARLLRGYGHEVEVAASVASAVSAYERQPFDLVISDLGLPDGTGHELLPRLMARRPVKAIALSGYGMDSDVRKSSSAGFMEHLTNPINPAQLQEAIERVFAKVVE